uniref:Zinc finger protein n=1 Tax=Ciona intestinalis TaxID=7719 RepID=Q1RPW9_CIOIN|nr:zinc finger protein [Ciona intestinalis]BAE93316.1 zinc finger protein [Ciona intestinalis]|eukprot:NP_001071921.1 zinc finger protein [Ciona intestinalis]
MAAEIMTKPQQRQPILLSRIEDDTQDVVTMAVFTPNEEGIITVSIDKSIRIWLKRETGQYWPSVCHFIESPCTTMFYSEEPRLMFVGQDNGNVDEFKVSEDYNQITHQRKYLAHQKQVTGCIFTHQNEVLVVCGKDKYITWHWTKNGQRFGGYQTPSQPMCLQYDHQSHYVFAGLSNGEITVLKINKNESQLITQLKGHSGSIACLCWDPTHQILYSGSSDKSIIMWDIGSNKGTAIELQGHTSKVTSLLYASHTQQLLSTGLDGMLVVWNMEIKRNETPVWQEGNQCIKCKQPFFWNFKQMWSDKTVGLRQHHCRKCGIAVCASCSSKRTTIPLYGFEFEVRVCEECYESVTEEQKAPTATFHDLKQSVIMLYPDWSKCRFVTSGNDRTIKLWDLKNIVTK